MNISGDIGFGSHLPILIKIVGMTTGPILELGMGMYSTPFLHWACFNAKRKLVSLDSDYECYTINRSYGRSDYHEVRFVQNWDEVDLAGFWDVVLIDHERDRRIYEIQKVVNSANYIIVHDSEGRRDKYYKYSQIYPLFKYRYDFAKITPFTVVLSNFKDLSDLCD